MRICHLAKWVFASFVLSILVACSSGSSSTGCADGGSDCQTEPASIDVMGTDGPLLDAIVAVYHLQDFLDAGPGAFPVSLIPATRTDPVTGLAEDLDLDLNVGNGPFILVVQADADTTDLTTGNPPEITTLMRVITSADFTQSPRPRLYATAFTTLAYEHAKAQAASATAGLVVAELVNAGQVVIQNFGFDIDSTVNVFNTPPILDGTTTTLGDQLVVASHRAALETFAEMLKQVASTMTLGGTATTGQDVFDAIVADFDDGFVGNNGQAPTSIEGEVVAEVNGVTPTYLTDTGRLPAGATPIQTLLDSEIADFTPDVDGAIDATPEVPDFDGDGIANDVDDGIYDDQVSDDPDFDGFDTNIAPIDNCPAVANADQANLDDDAFGNVCDNDADGDGADGNGSGGPGADVNDLDDTLITDPDGDGVDSSSGAGTANLTGPDNCPAVSNVDQANLDDDAFGNLCDNDADGDGEDGNGASGASATDLNDLDDTIALDPDSDGIDSSPSAGTGNLTGPDNCPAVSNTGQENFDAGPDNTFGTGDDLVGADALGNACDDDADGDGFNGNGSGGPGTDPDDLNPGLVPGGSDSDTPVDVDDNCPLTDNEDQAANGTSLFGDACDTDDDGFPDTTQDVGLLGSSNIVGFDDAIAVDNCPSDPNPTQLNTDGVADGGNACDADDDNDTIPDTIDPDPISSTFDYHFDVWLSVAESFAALDQFSLSVGSESSVRTDTSASIDLVNNNVLDLGTDNLGDGTLALNKSFEELEALLAVSGCTAGADCALANTPTIDNSGAAVPNVLIDPDSITAVYTPNVTGELALDFQKVSLEANSASSFTVETLQEHGTDGLVLSAFGQSFVGTERVDGLAYAIATGDACAVAIGVGAYTDQNDLQTKLDLLTPSDVAPLASANCGTPFSNVKDQQLLVVAPETSALATIDFNASSYGLVEFDVNFTTATATDLVQMNSRVSSIDITDTAGSVTQNTAALYASEMGSEEVGDTSDGQLTFNPAGADIVTALVAGDSGEGELELMRGGNTVVGFAANDLELLTFVGRTAGTATDTTTLDRAYAVKLGTGVTAVDLDGMTFDLQGLTYGASNLGLLASTFKGSTITFTEVAGSLSAQLVLGADSSVEAVFDDANNNLPVLAGLSEAKTLDSSADFTIDAFGRFSTMSFTGSGLELEGFYSTSTGLLLRVLETKAETAGAGGASLGFVSNGTVSANGLGVDLPAGGALPAGFYGWWDGVSALSPIVVTVPPVGSTPGALRTGFVVVPPAGATYAFAADARSAASVPQDFSAIDAAGADAFIDYFIRQGVLFGTPQNP